MKLYSRIKEGASQQHRKLTCRYKSLLKVHSHFAWETSLSRELCPPTPSLISSIVSCSGDFLSILLEARGGLLLCLPFWDPRDEGHLLSPLRESLDHQSVAIKTLGKSGHYNLWWERWPSLDGTLLSHNESEFFLLPSTVRICWVRAPKDRKHPLPVSIFNVLAPVVQTLDSAIHWINHYPEDKY